MTSDPWLQRWLPMIQQRCPGGTVLEIGCGHGDDTVVLARAGLLVTAFDLSAPSVLAARVRVPTARIERRDIGEPFPLPDGSADLVLASLSLHYFPWQETLAIARRVHAVLRPGGLLLCRLNSTEDHHFGASGHEPIGPNYFHVDGQPKRFFDEAATRAMFEDSMPGGWLWLACEHQLTRKYVKAKALWEAVLEKAPASRNEAPR